jgi:hypothetical protein
MTPDAGWNKNINITMMTLCSLFAKIFVNLKHLVDDLFTDEVSRLLAVPVVPIEVPGAFSQFSIFSKQRNQLRKTRGNSQIFVKYNRWIKIDWIEKFPVAEDVLVVEIGQAVLEKIIIIIMIQGRGACFIYSVAV